MAEVMVRVTVNDNPIEGLTLRRKFTGEEGFTLSGHILTRLKKGDIVGVEVIPITTDTNYTVDAGDARLNIKLERRF